MKKIFTILLTFVMVLSFLNKPLQIEASSGKVKLGVEVLLEQRKDLIKGKKVGLITNPTGVDSNLDSIVDLMYEDEEIDLVAMYGPEHGVRGDAQAGGTVESYIDEKTGVIVHSLYGNTKKPTPKMLEGVDTLIFDIQDVGARFYTYIYTMAYAMEAAQENDIEIIVLDRPNPLGGKLVDGSILEESFSSFVGMYPIPVIHGMTVGELAYYFNDKFEINADLTVVPMENWERDMLYDDTGLELVAPSPNMPTTSTIQVYPGAGFFEGTNMSEGRGTTKPFELIGAPFVNAYDYAKELNSLNLPGVKFRAASFTPTMSKHSGVLVHGVQIHVLNPKEYEPLQTGLEMIIKLQEMYPNDFVFTPNWNNTSYFFNTLMGNSWIREDILAGHTYDEISLKWQDGLNQFKEDRLPYLIYNNNLDLSVLDSLLEKAKNIDETIFSEESVMIFQGTLELLIEQRNDVLNEFSKNELIMELEKAFELLQEKEISAETIEKFSNLISKLEELKKENLTDESLRQVNDGLKEAYENKKLIDSGVANTKEVSNLIEKLKNIISNVKYKEEITDESETPNIEDNSDNNANKDPGNNVDKNEEEKLDFSKLIAMIEKTTKLDLDKYEEEGKDLFIRELENSRFVSTNAKTQEEIDQATQDLEVATNLLKLIEGSLPQTGISANYMLPLIGITILSAGFMVKKENEN